MVHNMFFSLEISWNILVKGVMPKLLRPQQPCLNKTIINFFPKTSFFSSKLLYPRVEMWLNLTGYTFLYLSRRGGERGYETVFRGDGE